MQCPQFFEFVVGISGDFVESDIFSVQVLFVQSISDIFLQFSLFPRQGIGQQVVDTLVSGGIFQDIAEINLHIYVPVFQRAEIFLEVFHCVEKIPRTLIHPVVYLYVGRYVAPVAVEKKNDIMHFALGDDPYDVFGQLFVCGDVPDTRYADRQDAVLASLLGFLFSFLYKKGLYLFPASVLLPDPFGNIHVCRCPVRRFVFEWFPLFVEMFFRILPAYPEILLHLSRQSPFLVFLLEHHRLPVEIVISDDGIVAVPVYITVGIYCTGEKRMRLGRCFVLCGIEYTGFYVVECQSALLQHTGTKALPGLSFMIFPGNFVPYFFRSRLFRRRRWG